MTKKSHGTTWYVTSQQGWLSGAILRRVPPLAYNLLDLKFLTLSSSPYPHLGAGVEVMLGK
jgi:hypothetical protein